MSRRIEPEWETGPDGRRFRRLGRGCIEYEPEISVNGIMVPVGMADEVRRSVKEQEEREKKEVAEALKRQSKLGTCPLVSNHRCKTDCAFYSEEGCMKSPETLGRHCPISNYGCIETCMLYENGCRIIKERGKNK